MESLHAQLQVQWTMNRDHCLIVIHENEEISEGKREYVPGRRD